MRQGPPMCANHKDSGHEIGAEVRASSCRVVLCLRSLRSVIGFLTIENAFEGAKVPFRRSRSVVETGAADFVLRLLYYGLRQLLQTLTSPHSVNLHLLHARCSRADYMRRLPIDLPW